MIKASQNRVLVLTIDFCQKFVLTTDLVPFIFVVFLYTTCLQTFDLLENSLTIILWVKSAFLGFFLMRMKIYEIPLKIQISWGATHESEHYQ